MSSLLYINWYAKIQITYHVENMNQRYIHIHTLTYVSKRFHPLTSILILNEFYQCSTQTIFWRVIIPKLEISINNIMILFHHKLSCEWVMIVPKIILNNLKLKMNFQFLYLLRFLCLALLSNFHHIATVLLNSYDFIAKWLVAHYVIQTMTS